MIITYYGVSCFKAQSGETTLAFDPFSDKFPAKDFGFKAPRFQADIVFVSHWHFGHDGWERLSGKGQNETPLVLDGPGEYESKEVRVIGVKTFHDAENGKKLGQNTIFTADIEGISLCHFGDFGEEKLRSETKEVIDGIDILFMPISGSAINPQKAARIAAQVEPKIVIPMHYHEDKKMLKKFLDEFGGCDTKPVDKLTIKKKDLAEKKVEIAVLNPII